MSLKFWDVLVSGKRRSRKAKSALPVLSVLLGKARITGEVHTYLRI